MRAIDENLEGSKSVLDWLDDEGVVSFEIREPRRCVVISEECDQWYSVAASKETLQRLIGELQALHDRMEPKE